jgi:hypothetical protein
MEGVWTFLKLFSLLLGIKGHTWALQCITDGKGLARELRLGLDVSYPCLSRLLLHRASIAFWVLGSLPICRQWKRNREEPSVLTALFDFTSHIFDLFEGR